MTNPGTRTQANGIIIWETIQLELHFIKNRYFLNNFSEWITNYFFIEKSYNKLKQKIIPKPNNYGWINQFCEMWGIPESGFLVI